MDPFVQYAIAAATMAVEEAALILRRRTRPASAYWSVLVSAGSPHGRPSTEICSEKRPWRGKPVFRTNANREHGRGTGIDHVLRQEALTQLLSPHGPTELMPSATPTDNKTRRRGCHDSRRGGGAICPLSCAGFCSAQAFSLRNDEPERASRPFDAERDGFVMGEGWGLDIIGGSGARNSSGANIRAEIIGYG